MISSLFLPFSTHQREKQIFRNNFFFFSYSTIKTFSKRTVRVLCSRLTTISAMSQIIDEDETYTYEILQEKHLEESTKLLAETFTKQNPLEIYLKTTYEQFYAQALELSKAILDEQLSIVAVHKQSKEIHGIVQAGDSKKLQGREFEAIQQAKDSEVYEELERRLIAYYGESKENDLVQILMVGIHPDCSGKGELITSPTILNLNNLFDRAGNKTSTGPTCSLSTTWI